MIRQTRKTAIAAAALAACAFASAHAEEQRFALTDFTSVSASAGTDVSVTVGGDYSVVATGDAKALERLKVVVKDGELQIGRKPGRMSWGRGGRTNIVVSMPTLNGAEVSSGASLAVSGVEAGELSVGASSGGSLDIDGVCEALTLDVSSGGSIDADALKCKTATADASSGGSADIFATESISADASSGGSIDVSGAPKQVSKETSSGGSVSVK